MRISKQQRKEEQAKQARIQDLDDRLQYMMDHVDDGEEAYRERFGKMLFSDDIYEECAIICSELGTENPVDK